jgi:hypothetical protein
MPTFIHFLKIFTKSRPMLWSQFSAISANFLRKHCRFKKKQWCAPLLAEFSSVLCQNAYFPRFLGENIYKILALAPGWRPTCPQGRTIGTSIRWCVNASRKSDGMSSASAGTSETKFFCVFLGQCLFYVYIHKQHTLWILSQNFT